MTDPAALAAILAAFFAVAVAPGPAALALVGVAVAHGRGAGLRFGAGLGLGLALWGLAAASGLGAALQTSAALLAALKIAGGVYLLWLALSSARAACNPAVPDHGMPQAGRWFLRRLMLNASNPKAVVAWMAALAIGLGPGTGPAGIAAATGLCAALGFAIYAGYAIAFSVPPVMRGYARARRWIEAAMAALLALAGISLLRSAFARSPVGA